MGELLLKKKIRVYSFVAVQNCSLYPEITNESGAHLSFRLLIDQMFLFRSSNVRLQRR